MIPYERQEKILKILADQEMIKIDALLELIPGVSISTLRRDLKELEKSGKIEYLFGGAVKTSTIKTEELPISQKAALNKTEKESIAERALEEITEGDTVYIDSGSTCSVLLKRILNKRITIYTTNTDIFSISGQFEAEIIIIGGRYNPLISSLSGSLTEEILKNFYFDKAFLGANGVDHNKGITTPNLSEAMKKRTIKKNSSKTFLLCDSTKFHKFSNVKALDLTEDIVLISDKSDKDLKDRVTILTPDT